MTPPMARLLERAVAPAAGEPGPGRARGWPWRGPRARAALAAIRRDWVTAVMAQPEVAVIIRSAAMLVHHGTPSVDPEPERGRLAVQGHH